MQNCPFQNGIGPPMEDGDPNDSLFEFVCAVSFHNPLVMTITGCDIEHGPFLVDLPNLDMVILHSYVNVENWSPLIG